MFEKQKVDFIFSTLDNQIEQGKTELTINYFDLKFICKNLYILGMEFPTKYKGFDLKVVGDKDGF